MDDLNYVGCMRVYVVFVEVENFTWRFSWPFRGLRFRRDYYFVLSFMGGVFWGFFLFVIKISLIIWEIWMGFRKHERQIHNIPINKKSTIHKHPIIKITQAENLHHSNSPPLNLLHDKYIDD